MTDEPVKRHCVVCNRKLPGNLTAYELKERGLAIDYGEGQLIFICGGARHTAEQIAAAAARPPAFHRASEESR